MEKLISVIIQIKCATGKIKEYEIFAERGVAFPFDCAYRLINCDKGEFEMGSFGINKKIEDIIKFLVEANQGSLMKM